LNPYNQLELRIICSEAGLEFVVFASRERRKEQLSVTLANRIIAKVITTIPAGLCEQSRIRGADTLSSSASVMV